MTREEHAISGWFQGFPRTAKMVAGGVTEELLAKDIEILSMERCDDAESLEAYIVRCVVRHANWRAIAHDVIRELRGTPKPCVKQGAVSADKHNAA